MSQANDNLVSVVIPVFNQESYVEECICSVVEQDYSNIQIIVVDDGSTDASAEIVSQKFGSKIDLIVQKNRGPSAAINAGLKLAKGHYIALLGGDDIASAERISHQVEILSSSRHDIIFSKPFLINDKGCSLNDTDFPIFYQEAGDMLYLAHKLFYGGNFLCAPSVMMRKKVVEQIGLFHTGLIQLQDYDYWLRALGNGFSLALYDHRVVYYRRHDNNLSAEARNGVADSEWAYVAQRFLNESSPGILRRAFQHMLKPVATNDLPLSEIEKNILLMAHSNQQVRSAAVAAFLNKAETEVSFMEAENKGFNPFRYLYNSTAGNVFS